jgi:ABC-type transport system involved in cytochrome bd biosynthesis fused ATPase/permease subunit
VLMIEHEKNLLQFADKVIILEEGKVVHEKWKMKSEKWKIVS